METLINPNYPRYVEHEGRKIRVESPLHHSQMIGKPVNWDATLVEDYVPPPTPEQQLAALYPPGEGPTPEPIQPPAPEPSEPADETPTMELELVTTVQASKFATPKRK